MKQVSLTINGVQQQTMAGPEKVLIDLLRKDLHLTGTKQSYDRKGQCGVCMVTRDTQKTVASGPAAGSRMTWMAGGSLVNTLKQMKEVMAEAGSNTYEGLVKAGKPSRYQGSRKNPGAGNMLDPKTGQSDHSFVSECHNIQMVELEVNTGSGVVRVVKMITAVDAGPVNHPQNLEGQIEGGLDQGVGYALREEYIIGQTKDYITFRFPTIGTFFESEGRKQ